MDVQAVSMQQVSSGGERTRVQPGKDEFFQLLVTQLRYQDPMSPMEDRDFIAQLAQFTMLEELQTLNRSQALAVLDRVITYRDDSGEIDVGHVSSVRVSDGTYHLGVNGRTVPMRDVIEIYV